MGSTSPYPPGFTLIENNLATHKLSLLRNEECEPQRFRRVSRQLGFLLCAAATKDLPLTESRIIKTPVGVTIDSLLADQERFLILPLLRAGLVVAEGFQELLPRSAVGHVGFAPGRAGDETLPYLWAIPEGRFSVVFLVASAITTAKSLIRCVSLLSELEIPPSTIRIAAILASRSGIELFYANTANKRVRIFAVDCDEGLTSDGRVSPGIGKAGDRAFGTEGDLQ
jgi:uracil phosphoribosyltransferase